ncbi:MAG: hypothetical protein NTZ69_13790 [Bacteroidia bacterium]|nr:hypothetical protein [Bacteroidia bacterium]
MKYILILIALFTTIFGKAQTIVNGRVVSTDKTGVSGLSVLIHQKNNANRILSYSITDEKGAFRLEFISKEDSLGVSVRSLTHRDTTIHIANHSQAFYFVLPPSVHEIREVNVNARAITGKKDTITYLVGKFAHVKDQSIGDVIRNMPGFEVSSEGQVSYQGKPIQKYYIEGLDLLEGRYAIANKNLPYRDVGAVEVLENHQPIKILESKVFSNNTSINLKLKKNITMTGTMQVGAGLPFLLHYLNATPMLFSKNQQTIASLQSNNTGEDLNAQNQPLQFTGGQIEELGNRKTNLVGIEGISSPQIDRKRYLNNNANLMSFNHLIKINDLTELKVIASFYHDDQKENGEVRSIYHLSNSDYVLNERIANRYYNTSLNTGFTLTQNVLKRYLKEQLLVNRYWDKETGSIENPAIMKENAETPGTTGSNTFDLLLPVGNHFFRIYSSLNFNDSPQQLSLRPGVFTNFLNNGSNYFETVQQYRMNKFSGKQFLRFTLTHKNWSFDTEPGLNFDTQHYRTLIQKDQVNLETDSLRNDYKWNNLEFYLTERISYKKENMRFGAALPFRAISYRMDDLKHKSIEPTKQFLFSPRFWFDYDFLKFWSVDGSIGYNSRLGDAIQLAQGYIVKDYHLMQRYSDKLNENQSFSGGLNLEYKNPVDGFFSVASWSHNQNMQNLINRNVYTGNGIFFLDAVKLNNRLISNSFTLSNSYVSSNQNISLSLKCQYTDTRYQYLLDHTLGWNHNQTWIIQPTFGINGIKNIGIDYNVKLSRTNQWNQQSNTTILGQVHKLELYYYPSPIYWFGVNLEYYNYGQQFKIGNNGLFANFGYTYKPANSRIEYRLRCNNLFNSQQVVDYFYGDISITESHYYIRPRELVLMISFSLSRAKK